MMRLWIVSWCAKGFKPPGSQPSVSSKHSPASVQPSDMFNRNDPIAIARHFSQLRLDVHVGRDPRFRGRRGDLRDMIAEDLNIGLNGSSLDRLARLLRLPAAIQAAISNRRITQSMGHAILRMPVDSQTAVAEDVVAGMSKADLIAKYRLCGGADLSSEIRFVRALTRFFRSLPCHSESLDVYVLEANSRIDLGHMLNAVTEMLIALQTRQRRQHQRVSRRKTRTR